MIIIIIIIITVCVFVYIHHPKLIKINLYTYNKKKVYYKIFASNQTEMAIEWRITNTHTESLMMMVKTFMNKKMKKKKTF